MARSNNKHGWKTTCKGGTGGWVREKVGETGREQIEMNIKKTRGEA